jgi:superfamily I DNA and/or RNA helicase
MSFNRNKRSISIDLKKAEGVALIKRMAAQADIVLESFRPDLHVQLDELKALSQERETLRQAKDLDVLNFARVIGATTSGAASYRDLLSEVSPSVVMVEEAGEVLEAHVLSALAEDPRGLKSTKHLILIGDHKQLRPKVESYPLSEVSARGYDLDVSLFERLVLGGHDSVTLQVQHRMRPSISSIIRDRTYPSLLDHESVTKYPGIIGVDESVDGIVFFDHRHLEDGAAEDRSISYRSTTKSNSFEADLSIEVVRFLLLQGYTPDRIVMLTPYVGQLLLLIRAVKRLQEVQAYVSEQDLRDLDNASSSPEGLESETRTAKSVRISSIDNFQGEESDLVVVSLVRSNKEGDIGFMAEKQRVNVLLSRARHGMILIGNAETLVRKTSGCDTWAPILSILEARNQIRDGLPTLCQLHPSDAPITLRQPEEFRSWRPNGGCQRPCKFRLSCGHVCPQMCHPLDKAHKVAEQQCFESCRRIPPDCPQGHRCNRL